MVAPKTKVLTDTGRMNSQSSVSDSLPHFTDYDGGKYQKDRGHEDNEVSSCEARAPYLRQG